MTTGASAPWSPGPGVVELPDGTRLCGRSLRRSLPAGPDPEFGVYLSTRPPGPVPWPSRWLRWRDFGLPRDPDEAVEVLREALRRAGEGQRVEVACGGGRGRTGTALAGIAVLAGVPAGEAVAWVRRHYHPRAVETRRQQRFVENFPGAA